MDNVQKADVTYSNPDTMHKNRAYTQVVSVSGPVKTVYIGGQNSVDAQGNIIGKGDLKVQTQQVLTNIGNALAAVGASREHLIKWNIYLVQGQSVHAGFAAFQEFWGMRPNPPIITTVYVAGLGNPDFLVEIEAVAVVPLS